MPTQTQHLRNSTFMSRLMHALIGLAVALALTIPTATGAQPGRHIFQDPIGVTVDAGGNVYVIDQFAAQAIKLSSAGAIVSRWGEQGKKPGQLNIPEGIAADNLGHIYVVDTWNSRIEKFSSSGKFLAAWSHTAGRLFFRPLSVATDRKGNVYVTDNGNDWVYRLSPKGKPLKRLGQFGNPTRGQFRGPTAVSVDRRGIVYVASYNWIYKLSPAGKPLAVFGTLRPSLLPGRFYLPGGLATDSKGNVYVADTGNKRIQVLSPSGAVLHVWGSTSGALHFQEPNSIAVDAEGAMYVTDVAQKRVVKLSPGGTVLATWQ